MPDRVTNAMINIRLDGIETNVAHIVKTTDEMHLVIHGNSDPKKGMTSRLTVLETIVERLERLMWMVCGAVVVAVIGAVFAVIEAGG